MSTRGSPNNRGGMQSQRSSQSGSRNTSLEPRPYQPRRGRRGSNVDAHPFYPNTNMEQPGVPGGPLASPGMRANTQHSAGAPTTRTPPRGGGATGLPVAMSHTEWLVNKRNTRRLSVSDKSDCSLTVSLDLIHWDVSLKQPAYLSSPFVTLYTRLRLYKENTNASGIVMKIGAPEFQREEYWAALTCVYNVPW